jgi:hypothetical protein
LLPEQYYDLTIGEILRHYRGYQTRESYQWERARFIAWFGSLPYQKKGSNMKLEDIMTLPTDPTDEEREIIRQGQEAEMKDAVLKVFESYRKMGYNV